MAWIESHQAIERHPKTLHLMGLMGWDTDTAIAKLHRFWWWCVDYAEDGDLRKYNDATIGAAVGLNGDQAKAFVTSMVEARWLDREPYFRVHDWWQYIGKFLRIKYKSPEGAAKWQVVRDAYDNNPPNNSPSGGCKARNLTNQPTNPTNHAAVDVGGAGGDELDTRIREYVGQHPKLPWDDAKTHANIRALVEKAGWGVTQALIDEAVKLGKSFPAAWALAKWTNGGATGPPSPADDEARNVKAFAEAMEAAKKRRKAGAP